MKRILIKILFSLSVFICGNYSYAQEKSKEIDYGRKRIIEYDMMFKHGMVNFGDTMLVDDTEILIMEWLEFIYYNTFEEFPSFMKKFDLTDDECNRLLSAKLDTTLFPSNMTARTFFLTLIPDKNSDIEIGKFKFYERNLHFPMNRDSITDDHLRSRIEEKLWTPITGISYEQALRFCSWRTEIDSLRAKSDRYHVEKETVTNHRYYSYQLLSPYEFEALIITRDSTSKDGKWSTFNYRGANPPKKEAKKYLMSNLQYGEDLLRMGAYVNSMEKREYLVDLQGNASELTSNKGVSKGGSFFQFAKDCSQKSTITYTKPEYWLGFRCCAKRIKK